MITEKRLREIEMSEGPLSHPVIKELVVDVRRLRAELLNFKHSDDAEILKLRELLREALDYVSCQNDDSTCYWAQAQNLKMFKVCGCGREQFEARIDSALGKKEEESNK